MQIRDIIKKEHGALASLIIEAYSSLSGFPTPGEQPQYYDMLANIGIFAEKPRARVVVAVHDNGDLPGGIVPSHSPTDVKINLL